MNVHVVFDNKFEPADIIEIDLGNSVCGVIDTIRATSTISTIIGCGGKEVFIASNKSEALKFKKCFNDFILCGEEKGLPPEGFDYGNSPLEISKIKSACKSFILMTTNGTQSILKAKDCACVYALSTLNLHYTIDRMIDYSRKNQSDIFLLCSGEKGKIAYDDAFTAGLAVKYMLRQPYNFNYSDAAKLALSAALSEFDITQALEKSCSAKSLRSVGLGEDIAFLSKLNRFNVAPVLKKITFKKLKAKNSAYTGTPAHVLFKDTDTIYVMDSQ